jgi:tricarballylate dehydrogenase
LVDIRYGSKVSALLGGDHQIEGVTVSTPASTYELQANAVILCSGGFQASSEMRARYLGPGADLLKVRGSRHDTGEVLQMALAIGAGSAGHWQGAHATPVDATYPDIEIGNLANRYSYRHGITVNGAGHRFFDEGEAEHSFTYAKTGWAISREPGGIAYQIFDQQGHDHVRWQYRRHATAIQANTIAQLANLIGIDAHGLQRTVDEFNAAVPGDPTFDPARPDGRATTGIAPQKSHWSTRIETPPFRAYPVTGGITFTFGGLRISRHAEVLNTSGHPIRGLYASGDVVGLFYFNYPSCTGQTRNAVFSRLAGRNAVRHDIPTESTTLAAR